MNSSSGETSRTSLAVAPASASRCTLKRTLWVVFTAAVLINYPWELAQTPLYVGMDDFRLVWWHCFVASLGDGLIVLLIFAVGWVAFRRRSWFVRPGVRGYLLMLVVGFVVSVAVEWAATGVAAQWRYAERMPHVLGVGLVPVAQMMVLPTLIFRVAAWWCNRAGAEKARRAL